VRHEKIDVKALISAPKYSTSILHITHLTLGDESSTQALLASLAGHAIINIDVIIANAGIANSFTPFLDTSASSLLEHFTVNTLGPLLLFQALSPLLFKSPQPKFILISSALASMAQMSAYDGPTVSYGISKAGANYLIKKLHFEHNSLAALAVHPGYVLFFGHALPQSNTQIIAILELHVPLK
jgi:norsolorinic acid ketoreductase